MVSPRSEELLPADLTHWVVPIPLIFVANTSTVPFIDDIVNPEPVPKLTVPENCPARNTLPDASTERALPWLLEASAQTGLIFAYRFCHSAVPVLLSLAR